MSYDRIKAFLASQSYGIDSAKQGQTIAGPDGSKWLVVDTSRDTPTGYQGALLKNLGTGKYELVSRGTEFDREPLKDGKADLQMGLGKMPDQVDDARAFLKSSQDYIADRGGNPNTDLSLIGHSLGGSITQVLGAENPQLPAVTFNPYDVGNLVPPGEYPNITNITNNVMAQDLVCVLPGSKMIGSTTMYTEPGNQNGDATLKLSSHDASNFLQPEVLTQNGKVVTIDVTLGSHKPLEPIHLVNPITEIDAGRLDPNTLLPKQPTSPSNSDPNHTPDYNFPDTAGAGRGTVNPDAATPPATVFNPATALPNHPGAPADTPGYVVQPGDTVSTIANKLGISPQQYGDYLRSVYGPHADLNSIVAGRTLPVPADAPHAGTKPADSDTTKPLTGASADNDYTPGGPTGEAEAKANMDKLGGKPANQDGKSDSGADGSASPTEHKPDNAPSTSTSTDTSNTNTNNDFHEALLDAFNNPNPTPTTGPGTQYAALDDTGTASDAGPGLANSAPSTNAAPSTAPEPTPNSFTTYLSTHGAALSPQQQDALARKLDQLNLGGASDLSFYPLPDGSTLIANADGDLVGELGIPHDGEISLRANAIDADGQASTHQSYISADGKSTSYSPQALAEVNAGLSLVKGLEGLQHWDQLGDIGRITSLINLATEAQLSTSHNAGLQRNNVRDCEQKLLIDRARAKASLRILAGSDIGTTQSTRAANDGFFRSAA